MFQRRRLKKVHAKFLESCRNLNEGRMFWDEKGTFTKWFLQLFVPVPLLGLHKEGEGLTRALLWLEASCKERALCEEVIKHYHKIVFEGLLQEAGQYRRKEAGIYGSSIQCPPPQKVSLLMKQLDMKLIREQEEFDKRNSADTSLLVRAAVDIHHRIVRTHPFDDGNGRVGRLAMNHLLRRYKQPYVIFPPISESREHFEALEAANKGNLDPLLALAIACRHDL